ncbi:hypothetical protein AB0L70_29990 [Kribbella sp. NPDC051952]|uniref:hypothetical protein n=1 Tax=Kribbella sp. NPDC051952 TaxID=3154851 RepID=UPI0034257E18
MTATLGTGLLLAGSTSASAQNTAHVPVFTDVRVSCGDGSDGDIGVTAKLIDTKATVPEPHMVLIWAGTAEYSYVVSVDAQGTEPVEFGGLPNNTNYRLQAQNAAGDVVASARGRLKCNVTPPTSTPTSAPTSRPTRTPSASSSRTSSTPPTTGTSSVPTTATSTPVAVPAAVDAGLLDPVAQDESGPARTIVGAGLLLAFGMIVGLVALLVRRRRGPHQL